MNFYTFHRLDGEQFDLVCQNCVHQFIDDPSISDISDPDGLDNNQICMCCERTVERIRGYPLMDRLT